MPNIWQISLMMRPSTSFPWSLKIERGMPNRLKTCSTNILAMGSASLLWESLCPLGERVHASQDPQMFTFGSRVRYGEIDIPTFKRSTGDNWLQ